jgi:predicted dehydrogenase
MADTSVDMLFHVAGQRKTVSAVVATQFPTLTLTASGQSFPNETPDGVVAIGRLEDDALFSIQIEGGKRNNAGLQIDITGTEGDLQIWNTKSFGNVEDNILRAPAEIEVRSRRFRSRPAIRESASTLDVSVQDLAHLYAAYASDRLTGTQEAPNFREGVRTHQMLDATIRASATGSVHSID